MEGKRFIHKIKITNLLSFGSEGVEIDLEPLNVIIGANASGKSNLMEVLRILKATPSDLAEPFRRGGGIGEWMWKGEKQSNSQLEASIETIVDYQMGKMGLRYGLGFRSISSRLELIYEEIENEKAFKGKNQPFFYYKNKGQWVIINVLEIDQDGKHFERKLRHEDIDPQQSILSQKKDKDIYPEITFLGQNFGHIAMFKEWTFGRGAMIREPQPPDLPGDFPTPDMTNLPHVLSDLQKRTIIDEAISKYMAILSERIIKVSPKLTGGAIQIFFHEKGLESAIPATRASDGVIRFLTLLTILLHPDPPPLVCIEEPELGLHPDMMPTIAELLIDASKRTQLIVTTHSDILVSALGNEVPESILVCEKDDSGSHFRRLEKDKLTEWLKDYSLGELWMKGELGGTRW